MVGVTMLMETSFKRTYASILWLPGLWYSVPLTPKQAIDDPCFHWNLMDTHRKVCLSLLWHHCSFLLGPGVPKVLFVPSNNLFPQSCGHSVIKVHWPLTSNSPVSPKGNHPWIFIGMTDAEAETPILWPPDAKSWIIGRKTWMLGKIGGRRRRGQQRMR